MSFIYERSPGRNRDHARFVRALTYTKEGLNIVLNYREDYSHIYDDINVIANYAKSYLSKNTNSKQDLFDFLLDAHTNHIIDLSQPDYVDMRILFLLPNKFSIVITDKVGYSSLISDLAVVEFQNAVQCVKKYNVAHVDCIWANFSRCLSLVDAQYISAIRNRIVLYSENNRILNDPNQIIPLIYSLSSDSCKCFFKDDDTHLNPEIRLYIYQRHKDSSILLHSSMLEYWNRIIELDKNPFSIYGLTMYNSRFSDDKIIIPKDVSDYIANSSISSDKLRLWAFIETSNLICFNQIEDMSLFNTWLPKQGDYCLFNFLEHFKVLPKSIISGLCLTLGASRVAQIASKYGSSILQGIPSSMFIRINVDLDLRSEVDRTETSGLYGGHWTWGEGMKNEKYDIRTYKDRLYFAKISVDQEHYMLVKEYYFNRENDIQKHIRACIENQKRDAVFIFKHGDDESIVYLTIDKYLKTDLIPLLQESVEATILISKKVMEI